jgi:hypothetical protein
VILAGPRGRPAIACVGGHATLDDLFKRAVACRPDTLALIDPPDRERILGGEPRQLTYREADRVISAVAGRLRRMGLRTDAIVAVQMASTVENVLTILGILRAGLIAMPLPILWRRADMVAALGRVGAMALIVSGRIGSADHYELAMGAAAEVFPIRHVCGYGNNPPDGLIAFDDLFTTDQLDPLPGWDEERAEPGPGAHLAVITWDMSGEGPVPVARSHAELIAAGLAVASESGLRENATLLSTMTLCSLAGIATCMVPWLLVGGTLALHHPFDADTYYRQLATIRIDTVVVPGPIAVQLAPSSRALLDAAAPDVAAVWRAPERLARALPWREPKARMTDILVFGETGLIAARRGADGRPAAIPFGSAQTTFGRARKSVAAEIRLTAMGTLAMRGPMVPQAAFPPGAERSRSPHLRVSANGYVDTGYPCRPDLPAMIVTGRPPGMVAVGGYRFALRELERVVDCCQCGPAIVTALADALTGHRLAATASDPESMQASLHMRGVNPLLVAAFGSPRHHRQEPDHPS